MYREIAPLPLVIPALHGCEWKAFKILLLADRQVRLVISPVAERSLCMLLKVKDQKFR